MGVSAAVAATFCGFALFSGAAFAETVITDDYIGGSYTYEQYKGAILNDTASGNDYVFRGSQISGNTLNADAQIIGGYIKTKGNVVLENVLWRDNVSTLSNDSGTSTMYMLGVDAAEVRISGGEFSGNRALIDTAANGTVYGMFLNVMYGRSAYVDGAQFSGNYASSNYRVQGGALNVNSAGSYLSVKNSSFLNNTIEAGNKARGAAVENYAATLDMVDSTISGNVARSSSDAYGAFYASNSGAVSNATNVLFANNSAVGNGYGGAMYVEAGAVANVNVTKDMTYSGNFAEAGGVKDDSRGGFLYMKEGGIVNFNVSDGATLTIGDGLQGYDSIANRDKSDAISKSGAGTLTVNGSMSGYTGILNVNEGVMNANRGLASTDINVASGATLNSNGGRWSGIENTASWENLEYFVAPIAEVAEGGTLNLTDAKFENNSFTHNGAQASGEWVKGAIYVNGALNMKDSEVVGTKSAVNPGEKPWVENRSPNVQGSAIHFNGANASGTFENVKFSGNSATGMSVQGGTIVAWSGKYKFDNTAFENNSALALEGSEASVSGGALYLADSYGSGTINVEISNSSFAGNTAEGNIVNAGAIIYESYNEGSGLTVSNTSFSGNKAVGDTRAEGGALRIFTTSSAEKTVFNDASFTGNAVEVKNPADMSRNGGGAIFANASDLEFNVTKDATYSGNYVSVGGEKNDALGGFIRLSSYNGEGSTASFNVSEGATLAIGDGSAGTDSIASTDSLSSVVKTGDGTLTVRGSMEHFLGTLNVEGGTMNLGSGAVSAYESVAGKINVSNGAVLNTNYGEGARNWLAIKNGQSVNVSGDGSVWKHSYQTGINEGGSMTVGSGAAADLGYLAFGGAAEIDGTLTLGKNWTQAQMTSNFGGDYSSLGGGKTVMNINDGGIVEAYAGINVGHRADETVSKDAEINVNAGGKLDVIGGDLNIGSTNYNDNGTSGKGAVNVDGGVVNVAQSVNIGTKADGSLTASNGAKLNFNDVTLGVFDESLANDPATSAPSAKFSASGSQVSVSNHLNIGKGGVFALDGGSSMSVSGENGAGDITIRNGGAMEISGENTSVSIDNSQHNIYVNEGGLLSISNGAQMSTAGNLSHGGILDINGGTLSVGKLGNIGQFDNGTVVNVRNGGVFNSKESVNLGFYSNYSQADKGGVMNVLGGTVNAEGGMSIKNGSALNVNESGKINSSLISIASDGFLNLAIGSENQINAAVENSGTITVSAGANLLSGNYGISSGGITGAGKIITYGGTYAGNVFTASEAARIEIDVLGEPASVGGNGRIWAGESGSEIVKISMAFNAESATVNSVTTATDSLREFVGDSFRIVEAYGFDGSMSSESDSVVISFLVNDSSLSASDFTIFQKGDSGEWTKADDVGGLTYDGQYLSFIADNFAYYGYAAVPEPAACAAIIGAACLALAAFRRRRR